jgi:hypothetical protein
MTVDNLSKVFAPTIMRRANPQEMAIHVAADAAFVSHLIQKLPPGPTGNAASAAALDVQTDAKAPLQTERTAGGESDEEEFGEDDWDEARAGDTVSVSRRMQIDQAEGGSCNAGAVASLESLLKASSSSSSSNASTDDESAEATSVMDEFALLEAMLDAG